MAEDDIYGNKRKYEFLVSHMDDFALSPDKANVRYWVKNKDNLQYFRKLITVMEVEDLSYVRRIRNIFWLKIICHYTEKDLKDCERDDINAIVANGRKALCPESQAYFIQRTKYFWKKLIPDKDEKGRIDDTVFPYVVRHLRARIDKSKERMKKDKLTWDEFQQIVAYFARDLRLQAYITLALESLGRPQEILYRRIRDVQLHDNYAKILISDHGKEGTGFLQCIDSFPYLVKWYNQHPLKSTPDAFLFVNTGDKRRCRQMTPLSVNKSLRKACSDLGIDKRVTCYSLKRNGVTFRRLRGDTDMQIQHAARWTSTRQLKIYDLSSHDDAFKIELVKRGLISGDENEELRNQVKTCTFCNCKNGLTDEVCANCIRPLDRTRLLRETEDKEVEVVKLQQQVVDMQKKFDTLLEQLKQNAVEIIQRAKT